MKGDLAPLFLHIREIVRDDWRRFFAFLFREPQARDELEMWKEKKEEDRPQKWAEEREKKIDPV